MNLDFLKKIVSIPSYETESQIGVFLEDALHQLGFTIERYEVAPGRFNLFALKNKRSKKKSILFYGHMDTVAPLQDLDSKRYELPVDVEGDALMGLGAYDMKGGIAAFMESVSTTKAYVKIFLAIDEEKDSLGAWSALRNNRDFFKDVELVISAEPNFDLGLNGITNQRTGRALIDIFFEGKSAHIAHRSDGIDALQDLGKFICYFYSTFVKTFKSTSSIGQIRKVWGESNGMSVCSNSGLQVEVLLGKEDRSIDLIDQLQKLKEDYKSVLKVKLHDRETPYLEGYSFPSFPYQSEISHIIMDNTNKEMKLCSRTSVGDDNVLALLGVPVITWGPSGGNAHSKGERVSLSSLETLANMYKQLLEISTYECL